MWRIIRPGFSVLWRDVSGGLLAYTAILAPVIVGAAGLSIDIGYWYATARSAQNVADSAAVAGALEIVRSSADPAQVAGAVNADALAHGFDAAAGDTITVHYPPVSGPSLGLAEAVEVVVVRPTRTFFAAAFFAAGPDVTARAVARANTSDTCVWALNPSAANAVQVSGNAQVNLSCGLLVNSISATALSQNGAGCLTASEVTVAGGYSVACVSPQPETGVGQVVDPLAALAAPNYGGCDHAAKVRVNNGNATLSPGVYCGGIDINTGGTVTFQPGLYVLNGGEFEINGQATVNGVDVSFYLTANTGYHDTVTINGGAAVSLSAPADGPLPGILFYHDRDAVPNGTHMFNGGAAMTLDGILYFPNQALKFSGGSSFGADNAFLIADTVEFTGNADVDVDSAAMAANPLVARGALVE